MTINVDKEKKPVPMLRPYVHYPFRKMAVGDSFTVPLAEEHRVRGAISSAHRRKIGRFTCRKIDGVCRVWRYE